MIHLLQSANIQIPCKIQYKDNICVLNYKFVYLV